MKLSGQQYKQFTDALLDAFPSRAKLAQMVKFRLEKNLDAIALGEDLQEIVFKLIGAAEAEGWTAGLLTAARESNPGNPTLLAFSQQFGLASSEISRQVLEKTIRKTNCFLEVEKWRNQLGEMEGRVCRVEIILNGGTHQTYGTGFLLGPELLITNYHVMEAVIKGEERRAAGKTPWARPEDVTLRFDFKRLANGITVNFGTEYKLAEEWLIDYSRIVRWILNQSQRAEFHKQMN